MLTATRPHGLAASIPSVTLPQRLRTAAADAPDGDAVVDGSVRLTYAELLGRAELFAGALHVHGFAKGDAVLIQLPNWWETIVVAWGTWLAGGVVLPVVPIYRAHELAFIIDQVDPAVVVAPQTYRGYDHAEELRDLIAGTRERVVIGVRVVSALDRIEPFDELLAGLPGPPVESSPDDIALVLYTSGTTSSPKGALHSHRTLLAESASIRDVCRLGANDRVFMPSPLSHITGMSYAVVLTADIGAPAVLLDRWEPEAAVEVIEAERCTFTVSATPFLRGLTMTYAGRGTTSSLRTFICGGADIPPELVRRAHAVMGTAVVRTYGSTEMPTLAMADPFGDLDAQADAEGGVIGPSLMAIRLDDGVAELVARGPELFLGYVDGSLNEASFTADGFFRTGDSAEISATGALRILGRIKDIINRGGEKYSAAEVEWALLTHPDVAEIAIVAYPDETLGERACVFIVPSAARAPNLRQLREHLLAAGFAVQKAPERLEIVAELPRTASGKIQKFRLREGLGWVGSATERESRT
ncbi:AMP-binding protein [Aeromicrobium sp.]|uniref:AMP-binding protein n=1 Tax=Aeromicrobium sp. TaxID=1871063 RepID=UPI0019C00C60|nr:AMP-binding protein [Aeromicrobium sp.]MBC7630906.1 AMP-binding protein [Aeromicrobium sp.]